MIATGLVVVGDLIGEGSAQEQSVVGETPNLAARLQALAEPDAVVIATGTRQLIGDLFEYRGLLPLRPLLREREAHTLGKPAYWGSHATIRPWLGSTNSRPCSHAQHRRTRTLSLAGIRLPTSDRADDFAQRAVGRPPEWLEVVGTQVIA